MSLIDGLPFAESRGLQLSRWTMAALLVLTVHVGATLTLLRWPDEESSDSSGSIALELAPVANTDHLPFYTQVNAGLSHEFKWDNGMKPTTLHFDVINVFDEIHEIRDGSGIGVFAPQFGPRRAYFVGLSQKF